MDFELKPHSNPMATIVYWLNSSSDKNFLACSTRKELTKSELPKSIKEEPKYPILKFKEEIENNNVGIIMDSGKQVTLNERLSEVYTNESGITGIPINSLVNIDLSRTKFNK